MTERGLQTQVKKWLDRQNIEAFWWTAINPAPSKTVHTASQSRAMGMKAGIPDLLFCYRGQPFAIELKASAGRLSNKQQGMLMRMVKAGFPVTVCRTLEEVQDTLYSFNVPIKVEVTG